MKRIYTILLLMILLGISVVGCQQETAQELTTPIESRIYNNAEYGFSVSYPKDWMIGTPRDEGGVHSVGFYNIDEGIHESNVYILTFHTPLPYTKWAILGSSYTLDDFCEEIIEGWADHEGFNLLEENDVIVSGLPAKEITFTYLLAGEDLWKHTIVAFLGKDSTYKIVYDMPIKPYSKFPTGYYDNYYGHFKLIVDTFKFSP